MKTFFNQYALVLTICASLFIVSCGDDNDDLVVTEPESEFDATLVVTEEGSGDIRQAEIDADEADGDNVLVKVRFATTTENMRRLYITQNIGGIGIEVYNLNNNTEGIEIDDKADGSVDLKGDNKKEFEFQIRLDKPFLTDGTVVYNLWTTTGRGDFRDISKRNAISATAVGTVTLAYGNAANSANGVRSFTNVELMAPTADGQSNSFFSLFTGTKFKINQYGPMEEIEEGENNLNREFVEIWDFGYYYGNTNKATIASVFGYELPGVNISEISEVPREEFNMMYFATTELTADQFVSLSSSSEIDTVVTVSTSNDQIITQLSEGDVIQFVDKYGNKGMILVKEIQEGFNQDDFIIIDIKVQV